jgi:serine protease
VTHAGRAVLMAVAFIGGIGPAIAPRPLAAVRSQTDASRYAFRMSPSRVAALMDAIERGLDYIPAEVVVKFRDGVSNAGRERALLALRSRPAAGDLEWLGSLAIARDLGQPNARILAAQLREQPEVEFAEPNYLGRSGSVPNDPDFASRQWNLQALDMPKAWDIVPGGKPEVVVAVIDNGVTTTTQTFSMASWSGSQIQQIAVPFAVNPDMTTSRYVREQDLAFWNGPVLDMAGHGSHVAATIAETTNNGMALAGMAYNASIMPVKTCLGYWDTQFLRSGSGLPGPAPMFSGTTCPTAATAAGIRYAADNGAKVINISLIRFPDVAVLRDAISYAVSRGAFLSISMGNDGQIGSPVNYPSYYAAQISGAMSVAAVGPALARAPYSTTGDYCEIAAPGGDFSAGGISGIYQTTLTPADVSPLTLAPRFDRYSGVAFQGTSMAAPHVAGLAALLMSHGVTSPSMVETMITASARDLGPAGRDSQFGHGLIQPRAVLFGQGLRR